MHGLVAYDDDMSDAEGGPSFSNGHQRSNPSEGRRLPKSQVIIKRPAVNNKNHHPRAHVSDDLDSGVSVHGPGTSSRDGTSPMDISSPSSQVGPSEEPQDVFSRIRALLKPPPIPGVEDWGIPRECSDACDLILQAKLSQFSALKQDPVNPKHFNDSLMSNRSFRNPHLYTKLVEFVDVDERTTNFPKEIWDPEDVKADWFADQIADAQKERSERQTAAQVSGKRSHIDFSRSKEKEKEAVPPKKSRFQPYGIGAAPIAKDRQKTRWG